MTRFLPGLVPAVLVALTLASCTPHVVLENLRRELETLADARRALSLPEPFQDFAGAIHVHTELSHDSEGTLEEIAAASRAAGSSFVITTDHHHPRVYERGFRGWLDGVLFVRGSEITKECRGPTGAGCNSLLVLGLDEPVERHSIPMEQVIRDVKARGGLAFAAHPDGFRNWDSPIDGMEVYDILDDAAESRWKWPKWFLDVLYSYPEYRREVFLDILDPPRRGLERFDEITRTRRITAIAGNDSHQNLKFRGFVADPYDVTLRFVRTHVLAPTLDEEHLLSALVAGRAYFSFDGLVDATGFGYWAQDGGLAGVMGDEVLETPTLVLRVQTPLPGRIRVVRGGQVVREADGTDLYLAPSGPGAYRVEVSLFVAHRWWPWIYSNPIYVREARGREEGAEARAEGAAVLAGAAARPITPVDPDGRLWAEPFVDANGNGRYDAPHPLRPWAHADPFTDRNGNGKWDGPFLAGFQHRGDYYVATGAHDPLWARAVVLRAGGVGVALVALDLIGLLREEVLSIRESLGDLGLDHVVVACTHTHAGPDSLGLWGPNPLTDGKDPRLLEHVRRQAAAAVREAASSAVPVRLTVAETRFPREFGALIRDRRDPIVIDDRLVVLRAEALTGETVAILVNGAVHPETLGQESGLLSSDFPHFLREGLEQGGFVAGGERVEGWGGVAIYFSGALGGLLTTLRTRVSDEDGRVLPARSFEKTQRIGELGAWAVTRALRGAEPADVDGLEVATRTFFVPVDNRALRLANALGVIQRTTYRNGRPAGVWGSEVETEAAVVTLRGGRGPVAQFLAVPGEAFPELLLGGHLAGGEECWQTTARKREMDGVGRERVGAAHPRVPPETPWLAHGKSPFTFVLGLANDELGYIVPANDFVFPRYLPRRRYGIDRCGDRMHYEETLSASSRLAPALSRVLADLLEGSTGPP